MFDSKAAVNTKNEEQNTKNGYVYTSAEGYLRDKSKFQRTRREYSYLPFYENINKNAAYWLEQIKAGLSSSTLSYAADSGISFWMSQLNTYLNHFYHRFSREDHIKLIKITYNIMLEPNYDRRLVHRAFSLMKSLINDEIINRRHLTLPWRPIYDLYMETVFKKNEKNLDKASLRTTVLCVKELFPLTATKEILDEIRPFIDIWNDYAMEKFVNIFAAFVPLKMTREEHEKYGAGLWFDEMWYFYNFVQMNGSWESRMQHIFSAISEYCPGFIDWTPKHTIIFSKLMRTFNLSVRYSKVAVGDGAGMGSESSGAEWIVWMLGGENESAHRCFERLIKCVESFLHPLQEGGHTHTLQTFLDALVNEMVRRVRIERVRKKTRNKVPEKMRLTNEQIEWFVSTLLPSVLYSVFSTTETSASNVMRNLAFLAPQLVLPRVLDLVYPSLSTVTEPHRLKQSLECVVEICVPLVRDNGSYSYKSFNVCKRRWIDDRKQTWGSSDTSSTENVDDSSSSEIDEPETRFDGSRDPLRAHAIILLDSLIECIDINDFNKLSLSLKTLETFFQLVPVVDCSAALTMEEYKDLNEEEIRLCKLTARFPNIVEKFVDKVFQVITQLSSSAPRDSVSCLDSICDNSDVILTGDEEILISSSIQSAFHLIGDRTYEFIRTSEFENAVAADCACALIQESTYANPTQYFPMYVKFLSEKQKQYITEDKKVLRELDATTMWYTYLSEMLFSVPSDLLLKYREDCIQMHKCTITMSCYNAYQGACWSLKNLLTQLAEVYPISEEDRQRDLDLPLRQSLPIRKWGAKCLKDSVKIKWHIPTDAEMDFAEKLLNEFAYPEIQLLAKPQQMDKLAIKRSLFIIDSLLACIGNRLPSFNTPEIKLTDTAVEMDPIIISSMPPNMRKFSFNGENIREKVRVTIHDLTEYLLSIGDDQSKNLLIIASILQTLFTEGSVPSFRARRKNITISYSDPVQGRRAELYDAFERRVFSYQKGLFVKNAKFTESHLKIMKDLVLLGTNFYTDVRISSQLALNNLLTKFPNSKRLIVDDVLKHLDPQRDISHEEMKGALYILIKCGFLSSSTISIRCQCWPAITKLKISEKPSIIALTQRCLETSNVKQWTKEKNINSNNIRNTAKELFVDGHINESFYANYRELSQPEAYDKSKTKFEEKNEKNEKRIDALRKQLIEVCKNKGQIYHWRHVDAARTFLFTFYRIHFTAEVAKVFLNMLVDVRAKWRHIAAECIACHMKWNKPLTKRIEWKPPKKISDPTFKYACGIRPDNLCIVYDESKLPKDEKTWNETIFVSKPHWGGYQWPKVIMVPAPANTQSALHRPESEYNDIEKLIHEYLKDEQFLIFWHAILLKEKEDSGDAFQVSEYRLVKYLFRNFGNSFVTQFKMLLESLCGSENEHPFIRRAQTKLAATYCAGIIRGSKNWLFKDLQEMWTWLKPIIIYQIEGLKSETLTYWDTALKFCLDVTDVRKFHWLIETIFEISSKPATNAWHRCIRMGLTQYAASCAAWRTTELLNRSIKMANSIIPQAWLAPEREQIAVVLSFPAVYGFTLGDENDIPASHRIPKLDQVLEVFNKQVQDTLETLRKRTAKSASETTKSTQITLSQRSTVSPKNAICIRNRSSVQKVMNSDSAASRSQLYIKTLLKLLNAYFLCCFVSLSVPIISLFPLITHLADEETKGSDQAEVERDVDLAIEASDILFQVWSGIYLSDELADQMLKTVEETMDQSTSWKAWASIMKFLHVFIFSNIYVCEKQKRPEIVRRMVDRAIRHSQAEVRREAADCLTALIHCNFRPVSESYIKELFESTHHKELSVRHGAVLALSAVIRAYPFTIPPLVLDMIPKYCQLGTTTDFLIRATVTDTLRSFLRTHHDKMIEMGETDVITKLLVPIQNVISPNYYV